MNRELLLIAAGGLARETAAALRTAGKQVRGLLDDDPAKVGRVIAGLPVIGGLGAAAEHPDSELVVCAGKGGARRAIVRRLAEAGVTNERYATVIASGVDVPAGCQVGAGSILLAGTVLTADVTVGRHVVCMPHVTLTHDDVIEDFATLAAGVALGGGVRIGEAAYLGMNSSVREGCRVGAGSTLGMGAVLLTDQPTGTIWAGVPAQDLNRQKEPK